MKPKLKMCAGCDQMKAIWKNHEGQKYCKDCWGKIKSSTTIQLLAKRPILKKDAFKKIKTVSGKKKAEDIIYSKLRKDFLDKPENSTCRAKLPGCLGVFKQDLTVHHMKGRGKYYLDTSTWIPLCLSCHEWVETHPKEAREMGFSGSKISDE
jgi:hypothetical protein